MKNNTLLTLLCLCLGSTPLWAPKGKDDNTPESPKPVAAAANPSTSQLTTPAFAEHPESFTLMTWVIQTLQSTEPEHAAHKEVLLQQCATTVALKILGRLTLPHNTTDLMAPFTNVCSLSLDCITSKDLPLLPCPKKLQSLLLNFSKFETISNIQHYTNLHTLKFHATSLGDTDQEPNQTERLGGLTQLQNLRTLDCGTLFTLDGSAPDKRALLLRILDSNPDIEAFTCTGGVATDVVQALANLPLRRLSLMNGEIDNDKFALLPFNTLEELRLYETHTPTELTSLEPLQGSHLRVLHLRNQENLGDTQVICSMPNLEELDLNYCRLTDEQAEPLLQLSQTLHQLNLDTQESRLSPEMRYRLQDTFAYKISLKVWPDDTFKGNSPLGRALTS